MNKYARTILAVVVCVAAVAFLAVRVTDRTPPGETPLARADRLCGACGLEANDVAWILDAARRATMTQGALTKYCEAYATRSRLQEPRKLCQLCVEAVLDAASH